MVLHQERGLSGRNALREGRHLRLAELVRKMSVRGGRRSGKSRSFGGKSRFRKGGGLVYVNCPRVFSVALWQELLVGNFEQYLLYFVLFLSLLAELRPNVIGKGGF